MFTYIKRDIKKIYVTLEEQLNPENYSNIGTNYFDYLDYKWVLLSEEQVEFHNEHPEATVREVLDMKLVEKPEPQEHIRTLEEAKQEKLREIDNYDNSENVNGFTINGSINAWFTPTERTNYKNSIDSAKLLSVDTLSLFIGDTLVTISTKKAEMMLAALQLYADTCFVVTKQHKLTVDAMTEIQDVDNYDYTLGYPAKLNFDIE